MPKRFPLARMFRSATGLSPARADAPPTPAEPGAWPAFAAVAIASTMLLAACAQMPAATSEQAPAAAGTAPPAASGPSGTSATAGASGTGKAGVAADTLRGRVSMYGSEFEGRKTASGAPFDPAALTMAHRTLPFGTRVRVTNLANQKSVEVVVNDRGPAIADRIADLSRAAAERIGMIANGVVNATLEVVTPVR